MRSSSGLSFKTVLLIVLVFSQLGAVVAKADSDSSFKALSEQWTSDKKSHWAETLKSNYSTYPASDERLMTDSEREIRRLENQEYFEGFAGLDPHKHAFTLNDEKTVTKTISNLYTITNYRFVTEINIRTDLALCPIDLKHKKGMPQGWSAQNQLDAAAWNVYFRNNAGGKPISGSYANSSELNAGLDSLCQKAGVKSCDDRFKEALKRDALKWEDTKTSETKRIEEKEQRSQSRQVESKTRVTWRIEPLIYFNLDFDKKIINKTPYSLANFVDGEGDGAKVLRDGSGKILLQQALSSSAGYEIYDSSTIGIGGGPSIQSTVQWGSALSLVKQFGFVAGGMLLGNKMRAIVRNAADKNAPFDSSIYSKPTVENIVDKWQVGDSMTYQLTGGYLLTAGATWMTIQAGPTFTHQGGSQHIVTKVAPDRVIAEVAPISTDSLALTAGAGLLTYSRVPYNEVKRTRMKVGYDLSLEAGRKAYEQLMIGNYLDTEVMLATGQSIAVANLERNSSTMTSDNNKTPSSWYFGLPFFYWNWLNGEISEEGSLQKYADAVESDYDHLIYLDNYNRRLGFYHKHITSMFYVGVKEKVIDSMPQDTTGLDYYGRYVWNFQNETTYRKNMLGLVDDVISKQTGLDELQISNLGLTKDWLGYVNIEIILELNKNTTNILMAADHRENGGLADLFEQGIQNYANSRDSSYEFCSPTQVYGFFVKKENIEKYNSGKSDSIDCLEHLRRNYKPVVMAMIKNLTEMKALDIRHDPIKRKLFAKKFREFGSLMMTNRFTFRPVYEWVRTNRAADFVRLVVNGEYLANMIAYFPSEKAAKLVSP